MVVGYWQWVVEGAEGKGVNDILDGLHAVAKGQGCGPAAYVTSRDPRTCRVLHSSLVSEVCSNAVNGFSTQRYRQVRPKERSKVPTRCLKPSICSQSDQYTKKIVSVTRVMKTEPDARARRRLRLQC